MNSTSSRLADRVLDLHETSAFLGQSHSEYRRCAVASPRRRGWSGDTTSDVAVAPIEADRTGVLAEVHHHDLHGNMPPPSAGTDAHKTSASSSIPAASSAAQSSSSKTGADGPPYRGVLLGLRVLKSFNGEGGGVPVLNNSTSKRTRVVKSALFIGTVVDYRPPSIAVGGRKIRHSSETDCGEKGVEQLDYGLYRVLFDDGDVQDMEPEEVYDCAALYHAERQRRLRDDNATTQGKTRGKSKGKRSKTPKTLIMGTEQRSKGSTARANLADGEHEMIRHANHPLALPDLKALDKERIGYWLEYMAYNLKRGVVRPKSLIDIYGNDAGWNSDDDINEEVHASSWEKSVDSSSSPALRPGNITAGNNTDQPKIITPPKGVKEKLGDCSGMPDSPLRVNGRLAKSQEAGIVEATVGRDEGELDGDRSLQKTYLEHTSPSLTLVEKVAAKDGGNKPGTVERTEEKDANNSEDLIPSLKDASRESTSPSLPLVGESAADGDTNDGYEPGESRPVLEVENNSTSSIQIVSDDESRNTSPAASPTYDPIQEDSTEDSVPVDSSKPKSDVADPGVNPKDDDMGESAKKMAHEGAGATKTDRDGQPSLEAVDEATDTAMVSEDELDTVHTDGKKSKAVEESVKDTKKNGSAGLEISSHTSVEREEAEEGEDEHKCSNKKSSPARSSCSSKKAKKFCAGFGTVVKPPSAERKRLTKKSKAGRARFPVLPLARKRSAGADGLSQLSETLGEKKGSSAGKQVVASALNTSPVEKSVSVKKQKTSHDSIGIPSADGVKESATSSKECVRDGDSTDRKRKREDFASTTSKVVAKPNLDMDSQTETELHSDSESSLQEAKVPSSKRACQGNNSSTIAEQPNLCAIGGEAKDECLSPMNRDKCEKPYPFVHAPQNIENLSNGIGSPVSVDCFDDTGGSGKTNTDERRIEHVSEKSAFAYKTQGCGLTLGHAPGEYTKVHAPPCGSLANEEPSRAFVGETPPEEPTRGDRSSSNHSTLSRHYDLGPGPCRAKPHIHVILSSVVADNNGNSKSGRSSPGIVKMSNKKSGTSNTWKCDNFLEEAQATISVPSPSMRKCKAAVSRFINPEYTYKEIIARDQHFASLPNISHLAECLAKKFNLPLHDWSARVDLIMSLKGQGRVKWPTHPSKDEMRALCVMVGLPGDEIPSPTTKIPVLPFQSGGIVEIAEGILKGKRGIVKWVMNEKVSLLVYQNGAQVEKTFNSCDVRVLSEGDVVKSLLQDGANKQHQASVQDPPHVGMDATTTAAQKSGDIDASALGSLIGEDDFFDEFVSELFDSVDNDNAPRGQHTDVESSKEEAINKQGKENPNASRHDEDFFSSLDHMLSEEVPALEDIFSILEKEVSLSKEEMDSADSSESTKGRKGRKGIGSTDAKRAVDEAKAPTKKKGRPRKGGYSSKVWGELGELTVLELKDCLRELGYKATGSKMELLKRLHAAYMRLDKGLPVGCRRPSK